MKIEIDKIFLSEVYALYSMQGKLLLTAKELAPLISRSIKSLERDRIDGKGISTTHMGTGVGASKVQYSIVDISLFNSSNDELTKESEILMITSILFIKHNKLLLGTNEVASLIDRSAITLKKDRAKGKGIPITLSCTRGSRRVLYSLVDIANYIYSNKQKIKNRPKENTMYN